MTYDEIGLIKCICINAATFLDKITTCFNRRTVGHNGVCTVKQANQTVAHTLFVFVF